MAVREPALRPLAALLFHQTEEWVYSGGFLPWINRSVLGSDDDEFPIDRTAGLVINVGFGWAFALSALAGPGAATPQAALYVSNLGNAALHAGWAIRSRSYDPGLATALLTLLPTAVIGLRQLKNDPDVSRSRLQAGIALGALIGAGMAPVMKLRLNRRRNAGKS